MLRDGTSGTGFALLLAAVLLAGSAGTAPADDGRRPEPSREIPLDSLTMAIAAFAAASTGLPMPDRMPKIMFDDPGTFTDLKRTAAGTAGGEAALEVLAFYDSHEAVVHLPAGWTGTTPAEQSILVHEITHHLQASSGRRFACPADREKQAYDAQEAWLALFGTDLASAFQLDRMFVLVVTTCGFP